MHSHRLLEAFPVWVTVAIILLLVLAANGLGIFIARRITNRSRQEEEGPIGTVTGATLGLLAFILAFTFGLATSRFDTRKQLLLDEVTAIETSIFRADLIPEPHRSEVRTLLKEYLELRIQPPGGRDVLEKRLRRSEAIQRQLWPHAAALADAELKNADIVSLFIDSLNDMLNFETRRVAVAQYRIPAFIWMVLMGVTIVSMLQVGYLFGRTNSTNWLFVLTLSLAFSGVMTLIIDMDRSGTGTTGVIEVSRQPMIDLYNRVYPSAKTP